MFNLIDRYRLLTAGRFDYLVIPCFHDVVEHGIT